ncbi:MAG: hypothetical protein QNJ53_25755 [Pleurocapsa sp. MO_192.B19]|nr:hypothetical protein [Pleurocapsa sp. MO_192.B19]
MKIRWKTLLIKTSIWLATEILLSFIGMDNLADYSEFVFEQNALVHLS